ncbi:MAG: HD domain-containing protein [Aureispira sp.]|nr:HD domain-containing protein [Aureispira sp.]
MTTIESNVQKHIAELFCKEDASKLFFHSYNHTVEVVDTVKKMALAEPLNPVDTEILVLSAWFHDVGYLYTYHEHEAKSIELAQDYFKAINYPVEQLEKIVGCIAATKLSERPTTLLESMLKDADLGFGVTSNFFKRGPLLRLEWEKQLGKTYKKIEWEKLQFKFLSNVQFHSTYAHINFRPIVSANLLKQKDILKKAKKKQSPTAPTIKETISNYESIESNDSPTRGVQSFFRTVYRNQINLSSIADSKANMVISINSIVITLIVAVFSLGSDSFVELRASDYLVPIVFFVVTSLSSLILAVFSVMPSITKHNKGFPNSVAQEELKKNIGFFGNFAKLPLDVYEETMQEVLNDGELLYGNMVRDIYHLGKVLDTKYSLLRYSYAIFLIGFILCVLLFLIISFI